MNIIHKSIGFRSILLLGMLFTLPLCVVAQDDERPTEQRKLPFTVRFDGGIGLLTSPRAMRDNFYSVGDVNLGAWFGIYKGWKAAVNFRYTGFQVARNASNFNDELIIDGIVIYQPIRTTHNMYTGSIALGYDRWISPYSLFNYSLGFGQSLVRYGKIRKVDDPPRPEEYNYEDWTFDASVNFLYFFEDHLAMTVKVGYSRLMSPFKPETVALDGGAISYTTEDLKGDIRWFSVALGFAWSLSRID